MNLVNTQVNHEKGIAGGGYTYVLKYSDAIIYTIQLRLWLVQHTINKIKFNWPSIS